MSNIIQIGKNLGITHNVSFQVINPVTNEVVSSHEGHNVATHSMLLGIGHYLAGEGVFGQGNITLTDYVPKFLSLGTMGLINHDCDEKGLPTGIGVSITDSEEKRFCDYMEQVPGFGADGYKRSGSTRDMNNGRLYYGLGPMYKDRLDGLAIRGEETLVTKDCGCATCDKKCDDCPKAVEKVETKYWDDTRPAVQCELISNKYPRVPISMRRVMLEEESEVPETIDVIFSGLISTGALASFRDPWRDYMFVTEAGMWTRKSWPQQQLPNGKVVTNYDVGENGLLAAYRIAPPDENNWDMTIPSNRDILKQNILRVGRNQVVQVIWKVQLGSVKQLTKTLQSEPEDLRWVIWNGGYHPSVPDEPSDINIPELLRNIDTIQQVIKEEDSEVTFNSVFKDEDVTIKGKV